MHFTNSTAINYLGTYSFINCNGIVSSLTKLLIHQLPTNQPPIITKHILLLVDILSSNLQDASSSDFASSKFVDPLIKIFKLAFGKDWL